MNILRRIKGGRFRVPDILPALYNHRNIDSARLDISLYDSQTWTLWVIYGLHLSSVNLGLTFGDKMNRTVIKFRIFKSYSCGT